MDKIQVQALVEGSKSFHERCCWLENFHELGNKKISRSDSRMSAHRVHKHINAFTKDYISFWRMIKSQDMSQEDMNRCLKEKSLVSKFV